MSLMEQWVPKRMGFSAPVISLKEEGYEYVYISDGN